MPLLSPERRALIELMPEVFWWKAPPQGFLRYASLRWQDPPQVPAATSVKRTRTEPEWSPTSITAFISSAVPLISWPCDTATPSFNLQRRAWPAERPSWEGTQPSRDGSHYFQRHFGICGLLLWGLAGTLKEKTGGKSEQIAEGGVMIREICPRWFMSGSGGRLAFSRKYLKSKSDTSSDASPQRSGGVLCQRRLTYCFRRTWVGGGVGERRRGRTTIDTSPHLAGEIKGHLEKAKINVSYQFCLSENVTRFSLTPFN